VVIVEAGAALTDPLGSHARNRDPSAAGLPTFASYIETEMTPPGRTDAPPEEMPGLFVLHAVGGMLTAWTHNCPEPDASELPDWLERDGWPALVQRARERLGVTDGLWSDNPAFLRLLERVTELVRPLPAGRRVAPMPVAVHRQDGRLRWTGADALLGDTADRITVLSEHVARDVLHRAEDVTGIRAFPVAGGAAVQIEADAVVLAGGTIGTAQLIAASGLHAGDAFGRYLMEHVTMCTRVLLREDVRVPDDGTPATFGGLGVWIPASVEHPWHAQLVRHPIDYVGTLPDRYDIGDSADLLAMCPVTPDPENHLRFDPDHPDAFGLPRVRGRLELSAEDDRVISQAVSEQLWLSARLGDIRAGWSTVLLPRGSSTHVMGSCRMGPSDDGTSVVSPEGRMWGYENCFVAGNAVFASANATNPTLTTVAFALRCADAVRDRIA
jgi:GMC oxidoreductase